MVKDGIAKTVGVSLDKFFYARSVAVIGASREVGKVGYTILESLKQGYTGKIFPINPTTDEILGLKCYKSVLDVVDIIDVAVIAVPKGVVPRVLKDCVKIGVEAVVIITSGYSEIGDKKSEQELLKIIKGTKTRIIGTNCLGILDGHTNVDTLFLSENKLIRPPRGNISFTSQSGAFGSTILDLITTECVGLSKFVSYGNQIDLKDIDFLEYFGQDEKTKVIVSYIEGVSDGRRFMDVVRKIVKRKPIIVFKSGKTEKGSKAAASHTGSLAGSYNIYKAAFKQSGVLEATSVEDIFDFAKALDMQKPAKGGKIAIVTNGGGFGVITSDCIETSELNLAEFSKTSCNKLRKVLPVYGNVNNPLDLVGDADKERYRKSLEILIEDRGVDGIIIISLFQTAGLDPGIVDVIVDIKNKTEKPIVICATGGDYTKKYLKELDSLGIPTYPTPERAVKAMWALVKYGEILGS